jgi:hypothetical protein
MGVERAFQPSLAINGLVYGHTTVSRPKYCAHTCRQSAFKARRVARLLGDPVHALARDLGSIKIRSVVRKLYRLSLPKRESFRNLPLLSPRSLISRS